MGEALIVRRGNNTGPSGLSGLQYHSIQVSNSTAKFTIPTSIKLSDVKGFVLNSAYMATNVMMAVYDAEGLRVHSGSSNTTNVFNENLTISGRTVSYNGALKYDANTICTIIY